VKKIVAGAVGGAAALTVIFGAGPATADDEFKGQTYEKALEGVKNYGGTAVIAGRVGNYLPTDQCVVVRSRTARFLDSSGSRQSKQLLYLNCNDPQSAGHPGYSVTTPEGKKAQKARQTAATINDDYVKASAADKQSWCEQNAEQCGNFCKRTGLCSEEVNEFLGL
jgi:hypothetical protein